MCSTLQVAYQELRGETNAFLASGRRLAGKFFKSRPENLPSGKLTWQWNITISNRKYIFKGSIFHCYVRLPECSMCNCIHHIGLLVTCKLCIFLIFPTVGKNAKKKYICKTHILEPENGPLEKEKPFRHHHFQVHHVKYWGCFFGKEKIGENHLCHHQPSVVPVTWTCYEKQQTQHEFQVGFSPPRIWDMSLNSWVALNGGERCWWIWGSDKCWWIEYPPWNSQQVHPKMDGWHTRFLLGWPIFRGELLVSGRVYHYNLDSSIFAEM